MREKRNAQTDRPLLDRALEVFTVYSFAVAQPLFDLLSRGPDFLLAHHLEPKDLALLVAAVCCLPPAVLVVLEALERLALGRSRLHSLWLALLGTAFALLALKGLPASVAVAAAVVLGALFAGSAAKWREVRLFLRFLSPAILVFPALFLCRPPISGLLFPRTVAIDGAPVLSSKTPIVLVVLDELPTVSLLDPSHNVDARRYPAFRDLADHSYWFRNATTVAESTTHAVPAILTGRYPDGRKLARLQDHPENLFTWLGASHSMNVYESLSRLCPDELRQSTVLDESFGERIGSTLRDLRLLYFHLLLPASLTAGLPQVTSAWRDFESGGQAAAPAPFGGPSQEPQRRRGASAQVFTSFVDSIRPTERPALHFLHVNLPHIPWKYTPSGKEYGPPDARLTPYGLSGEQWIDDEWATIQGFQRHLLQLAYTDRLLGQLMTRLREVGIFDRSLVIVTADHGVSFWPGRPRRGVTDENPADILAVPLFVKRPFQTEGLISDRNVETIDILPTIADVLGADLPWPVDGSSVLGVDRPARAEKVLIKKTGEETFDRVTFTARLDPDATLERMLRLFGSGEDPASIFRVGRFRHLVGLDPTELPLTRDYGRTVDLSDANNLENYDPDSGYVPSRIVGSLGPATDSRSTRHLAVAVNGSIRAVTRSYVSRDRESRFSAMIPEESLRRGFNRVDVFEIVSEPAVRLVPFASRPAVGYTLNLGPDPANHRISASDGHSYRIVPEGLQGEVVFNGVSFRGWAADVEQGRAADSILLFSDGQLVTRARTGHFRRDVARRFGISKLSHAGFSFVVPYSIIGQPDAPGLEFFAILDGVATQLPYRDAWTRP